MDSNHRVAGSSSGGARGGGGLQDQMDGFACRNCGFYNLREGNAIANNNVASSPSTSVARSSLKKHHNSSPNVPKGLDKFLLNFTVSIIEKQPTDLAQFACEYFNNIQSQKLNERKYPVRFFLSLLIYHICSNNQQKNTSLGIFFLDHGK